MPIQVNCPACGRTYRLKDELAGKKFRCSDCQKIVTAPALERPVPPPPAANSQSPPTVRTARRVLSPEVAQPSREDSRPSPQSAPEKRNRPEPTSSSKGTSSATASVGGSVEKPAKAKRRSKSAPESRQADSQDSEFDDLNSYDGEDAGWDDAYSDDDTQATEPAPKSRSRSGASGTKSSKARSASRSGGWSIGFNIGRLNVAMVVVGFVILMIGCMELSLSRKSNSTPVPISLAELLQNGAGSNIYFTVSGIQPVSDEFVYEERSGRRQYYTKVYFACQPAGAGNAAPVRFVIFSTAAKDDSAVMQLMGQSTHTGMITNSIRRLGADERQLLQSAAPGADLSAAMIFEVGRHPSGALKYLSLIGSGLALLLVGLAWIFVRPS